MNKKAGWLAYWILSSCSWFFFLPRCVFVTAWPL